VKKLTIAGGRGGATSMTETIDRNEAAEALANVLE
jgi:hypothetical protein